MLKLRGIHCKKVKNKKHIIITSLDMFLMGGIERSNCSMAKLFLSNGHKVSLISFFQNSSIPFFDFGDIPIVALCPRSFKSRSSLFNKFHVFFLFFSLMRKMKEVDEDYVLISNFPSLSILHSFFSRSAKNVIAFEHSGFAQHPKYVQLLRIFTYKKLKAVVTLTNHDCQIFKQAGVNCEVIPNFSKIKICDFKEKKKRTNIDLCVCGKISST